MNAWAFLAIDLRNQFLVIDLGSPHEFFLIDDCFTLYSEEE
jgi:hypothetical protein